MSYLWGNESEFKILGCESHCINNFDLTSLHGSGSFLDSHCLLCLSENSWILWNSKIITVFTQVCHWTLSWDAWMQSAPSHPPPLRSVEPLIYWLGTKYTEAWSFLNSSHWYWFFYLFFEVPQTLNNCYLASLLFFLSAMFFQIQLDHFVPTLIKNVSKYVFRQNLVHKSSNT